MPLHAYVCDRLRKWIHVCVWQIQPVCKMCDYMHTCVADYANVFMLAWEIEQNV